MLFCDYLVTNIVYFKVGLTVSTRKDSIFHPFRINVLLYPIIEVF